MQVDFEIQDCSVDISTDDEYVTNIIIHSLAQTYHSHPISNTLYWESGIDVVIRFHAPNGKTILNYTAAPGAELSFTFRNILPPMAPVLTGNEEAREPTPKETAARYVLHAILTTLAVDTVGRIRGRHHIFTGQLQADLSKRLDQMFERDASLVDHIRTLIPDWHRHSKYDASLIKKMSLMANCNITIDVERSSTRSDTNSRQNLFHLFVNIK